MIKNKQTKNPCSFHDDGCSNCYMGLLVIFSHSLKTEALAQAYSAVSSVTLFGDFNVPVHGLPSSLTSSPPTTFSPITPQQPSALLSARLLYKVIAYAMSAFPLFSNSSRAPFHYHFSSTFSASLLLLSFLLGTCSLIIAIHLQLPLPPSCPLI